MRVSSEPKKRSLLLRVAVYCGVSTAFVGCTASDGAPPSSADVGGDEEETDLRYEKPLELARVSQAQTAASGCIRSATDYVYVGGAVDLLTGTTESFPFDLGTDGRYEACEEPAGNVQSFAADWVTTKRELEEFVSKGFSVDAAYKGYGVDVSSQISADLSSHSTFSSNEVLYVARVSTQRKRVTLSASAEPDWYFIQAFQEAYYGNDHGMSLHNQFGDAYVKTAVLGNEMYLLFTLKFDHGTKYKASDYKVAIKAKYEALKLGSATLKASGYSSAQLSEMIDHSTISVRAHVVSGQYIPIAADLTMDAVKSALDTFNSFATNGSYTLIGAELESYGERYGYSEYLYDWRTRGDQLHRAQEINAFASAVAATNTAAFRLSADAASLATASASDISVLQDATRPAPPSREAELARIEMNYDTYLDNVDRSYRFLNKRSPGKNLCMGAPGSTVASVGTNMVGEACRGSDEQLFRWTSSRQLMTVDNKCIGLSGESSKNDRLIVEECSPRDSDQRWLNTGDHAVQDPDATWGTKQVSYWTNDAGGYFYADSMSEPATLRTRGWSQSNYAKFDWIESK